MAQNGRKITESCFKKIYTHWGYLDFAPVEMAPSAWLNAYASVGSYQTHLIMEEYERQQAA